MASSVNSFGRQTWALIKKNITILLVRSWFWTAFRSLVIPIVVVTLLLEIPNFTKQDIQYGISNPTPARSLAQSMDGSRKLAIIQTPGLDSDVQEVVKRLVEPLDQSKIIYLNDPAQTFDQCQVDFQGNSNCHAVIRFNDSPGSMLFNGTWNYTVQVDSNRLSEANTNVYDHTANPEGFWLPLQTAIDNAITNTSTNSDAFSYQFGSKEEDEKEQRQLFLDMAHYILSFVFFISMSTVVHHVSSLMAGERDSGMSQLIDAMGGGMAWQRVVSYMVTFDILYLPVWIILGCLFWNLLLPSTSPAITIFWQILTGWATTNASIFATAWFKRSSPAAITVTCTIFVLAVLGAYVDNLSIRPVSLGEIAALGFFFPSMNYIFFFGFMSRSEERGIPTRMNTPLYLTDDTYNIYERQRWVYHSGPYFLWVFLVIQIIVYPILAVFVEQYRHGNNRQRRSFNTIPEAENSHIAIETIGLEKHYKPSVWKRIFCCSRKPTVKAVDGLSLTSQKRQILCLLGPNGSGKTTALDMMAGFQKPTEGSITINALPTQIGVCPQKNVMWDQLTVYEHLQFWNAVKGGSDDNAALVRLLETCDLIKKKETFSNNLSGGMKRKLQLACMLVGGSSVCLMDEVTSGLDPISRRVIWNAVLKERSRRTMIFTTHFLDECEVLSDHIVIVSLGKLKCQGTPAELKNQYGAGYRVHLPKTADVSSVPYPIKDHGDSYICTTPDSSSAARLLTRFTDSRLSESFITGPTIEDVFLKVSEEPSVLNDSASEDDPVKQNSSGDMAVPGQTSTHQRLFFRQFGALFLKRIIVLRSQWWVYFFVLAIPLIVSPFLGDFLEHYNPPQCQNLIGETGETRIQRIYGLNNMVIGPISANQSMYVANNMSGDGSANGHYYSLYGAPVVVNDKNNFTEYIRNYDEYYLEGGVYIDNSTAPLLAFRAGHGYTSVSVINFANIARTGVPIHISVGVLKRMTSADMGNSVIWSVIYCLVMAVYPAFFSLYPTFERRSKVRALQASNGVRALPLWLSYMLFDMIFVLLVSVIATVLISPQTQFWQLGHAWFVQFLYGIAAMLTSYIVSTFSSSQPAAIAWSMLIMIVEYILSIITMVVVQEGLAGNIQMTDGTTYGLGIIFPIQNLMRAMAISMNTYIVRCRGTTIIDNPASFYAYGGPICLLIIQIIGLFILLLWLDGSVFSFSKLKPAGGDAEKSQVQTGRPDVDAETSRVTASQNDLLRMLHISKRFGANTAVEDVSLGMREGEILALLGPNGAGKTTCINMIRGDVAPSSGNIMLEGVDVQKDRRLAQTYLGVCPQFDALDMLTVREHLTLYARCKGVRDVDADVAFAMSRVGITAHQHKMGAKLSGGQKRKLSLGIALLGNPPVLLLDEPSSAMDAASKRVMWRTLEAVAPGRSLLLTTHSMEEADALATRAAIISRRLLAVGSTQDLRKAYSNEYHVHLVLRSAPLSTPEEMQRVADWVIARFGTTCDIQFEGENLGGQVRFIVPADAEVPPHAPAFQLVHEDGDELVSALSPTGCGEGKSFIRCLIEMLEDNKDALGLNCYSIGAATMERVFLSVVKHNDAAEEEDEKKSIWRRLGLSRN